MNDHYDDDYCDDSCLRCDGEGTIMVCIDDICHGLGYCIHGDGEIACPNCRGTGLCRTSEPSK